MLHNYSKIRYAFMQPNPPFIIAMNNLFVVVKRGRVQAVNPDSVHQHN